MTRIGQMQLRVWSIPLNRLGGESDFLQVSRDFGARCSGTNFAFEPPPKTMLPNTARQPTMSFVEQQMLDIDAVQERCGIGDQSSMTPPPHGFRTHDPHASIHRLCQQAIEGISELVGLDVVGVRAKRRVAERDVAAVSVLRAKTTERRSPIIRAAA
jgi:hypothetical protein